MNSDKIEISGGGFRYDAHVGRGLLRTSGALVRGMVRGNRAAIITDANIPAAVVETVAESLARSNFKTARIVIAPGENAKSLRELERACGEMLECDRSSVVVGIGGGVVGDLSGFVAAIFHRGISHVQIPTTLLAMVDSSIGGKTAVNLAGGKNLVGAIHHPVLVLADLDVLTSLPPDEMRQGYAEIVKHAVIADAAMFEELRRKAKIDLDALIPRNIRIKASFVSTDDRDTSGKRALLNFGHTIGHGIEQASGYTMSHGDCVSLGMVAASRISARRAGLPAQEVNEIIALLQRFSLPTALPITLNRAQIVCALQRDKKFEDGMVRFVVTPGIGRAFVSQEVGMSDIREVIEVM